MPWHIDHLNTKSALLYTDLDQNVSGSWGFVGVSTRRQSHDKDDGLSDDLAGYPLLSPGAVFAQQTTLTFWSWRVEDREFYNDIARQFEARTGIRVVYTPYNNLEYNTILSSALAAGTGPDIIHTRAYGGLAQLADAGYLLPITNQQVPNLARFPATLLNAARGFRDDTRRRLYGVPFATQSLGFFYNKDLLTRAGIGEIPDNWPDFKAMLARIRAAGIVPLANGPRDGISLEQIFGVIGPNFYGGSDYFRAVTAWAKDLRGRGLHPGTGRNRCDA